MYVVFEDNGQFKAEKILSEADTSLQVESASGKRSKIKRNNTIFFFDNHNPLTLLEEAGKLAEDIDLEFLWECAPQQEFQVEELARDYFGHEPGILEKTALLLRLHGAPVYFHRKGKGQYRPAPPDILKAALATLEKKQKQAEQQASWIEQIKQGIVPEAFKPVIHTFLAKPDKNTLEWKAFNQALNETGETIEQLLLRLRVYPHPLAIHREKFLGLNFPKGTQFKDITLPAAPDLPLADVEPYSVDDLFTTEIDDAFSVHQENGSIYRIGIHIAAPALIVERDSELDKLARERMSTVYMPGDKIPMQPESVINTFSLVAGKTTPAVSLYIRADIETGEILSSETRLEQICVQENLRTNLIDHLITVESLEDESLPMPYPFLFRPLWKLGQHLKKAREVIRGKPENNSRVEYTFVLDGPADDPHSVINLAPRRRDAPLDLIVAEFMLLANTQWAGFLNDNGLPGIFRSQQAGRTRMSTHPLPHETIGVPHYAWCTSPLRRYVDLINQSQIIAAAQHGISARLVAPFKPKDADLFAIIGAFESQYTLWGEFQNRLERFWCLRWFEQQQVTRVEATVLRDNLVRFNNAPFVTEINGMPELERGSIVEIELMGNNLLELTLDCQYIRHIEPEEPVTHATEANPS
ncbi:MAG: RNB domain-containing ribonuclease [Alcaligenaceae bacterium]|jgi:exoribonuclease-2|nr:RNB domain-containing ribonuclease [Alcaligenaceae bacterium]